LGNTWNFGVSNGAGIVGMGVNSPFLKQFIDPQTQTLSYGVVVQRSSTAPTGMLSASVATSSNITFGNTTYTGYTGNPNITVNADPVTGYYLFSNTTSSSGAIGFGFGGVQSASTWYYNNLLLDNNYQVQFSTSFLGVGLLANAYKQFV
jgi:hypothetical protein